MSKFFNPICTFDCPDPDVIPYKDGFLMITSSFHFVPGLPLYYSKVLVHFKLVSYLFNTLPMKKYNSVHLGHGIWAPSIREHKGTYYAVVPFPDEGIYVVESKDPLKKWSKPRCIWKTKGIEDPCPIWIKDKTYLVFAFIKSRIGFNSKLGLIEVDEKLTKVKEPYQIIFDGTISHPTIEGPKCYQFKDEIMILAPAGGVENGYQLALRSKSIFGPFEEKIILKGFDDTINGPHQGALVEYKKDQFVFYHFQDVEGLGRILHLEPVTWIDGWPICGTPRENTGAPVKEHEMFLKEYPYPKGRFYFDDNQFPMEYQYPCNPPKNSFVKRNRMIWLNALYQNTYQKEKIKNCVSIKIPSKDFIMTTAIDLKKMKKGDEVGLLIMGNPYIYISIRLSKYDHVFKLNLPENNRYYEFKDLIKIKIAVKDLWAQIYIQDHRLGIPFLLNKGNWVGNHIGFYAISHKKHKIPGKLGIIFARFDEYNEIYL